MAVAMSGRIAMKPVPFESWRFGDYTDILFIAVSAIYGEIDGSIQCVILPIAPSLIQANYTWHVMMGITKQNTTI